MGSFGTWMRSSNLKRPTEAVVLGAAVRAAAGDSAGASPGVTFEAAQGDMHARIQRRIRAVRPPAGARGAVLVLDKKGQTLSPHMSSGLVAAALDPQRAPLQRIVVLLGGPAGLPKDLVPGLHVPAMPVVRTALRGGTFHSYTALAEILSMHERDELVPALDDLLVLPKHLAKAWRRAEREVCTLWLSALGLVGGGPRGAPAPTSVPALLDRHHALVRRLSSAAMNAPGPSTGAGERGGVDAVEPPPGLAPRLGKRKRAAWRPRTLE